MFKQVRLNSIHAKFSMSLNKHRILKKQNEHIFMKNKWLPGSLLLALLTPVFAQEKQTVNDWENPAIFQINREPARATFLPFADKGSAVADIYENSPWFYSLNGNWKFQWSPTPD